MRKTESSKTRIVLLNILSDLKDAVWDKDQDKFNKTINELKQEFTYYLRLDE